MSGTGAAAASVTNSVWEVDKIAEVDFGGILGTRAGAVAVGMRWPDAVITQATCDVRHT